VALNTNRHLFMHGTCLGSTDNSALHLASKTCSQGRLFCLHSTAVKTYSRQAMALLQARRTPGVILFAVSLNCWRNACHITQRLAWRQAFTSPLPLSTSFPGDSLLPNLTKRAAPANRAGLTARTERLLSPVCGLVANRDVGGAREGGGGGRTRL